MVKLFRKRERVPPEPEGVRAFNILAVYLLDKLYQSFPTPVSFKVGEEITRLVWNHFEANPGAKPDEITHPKYLRDTIAWLIAEGYIRRGGQTQDGYYSKMSLTGQALAALQKTPRALTGKGDDRKTFGTLFREALAEEGAGTIVEVGKTLFTTTLLGTTAS